MGYSRQQFYEIRRNFQTYGADGLLDRLPGAKGPQPNRVATEIEMTILDHALAHPCHGPTRVAHELMLRGIEVSSGGVRGVWQRHSLLTKHDRLLRLEKAIEEMQTVLDQYLVEYNTKRPHQGRGMNGRTPTTAFIDGIKKEDTPQPNSIRKAA